MGCCSDDGENDGGDRSVAVMPIGTVALLEEVKWFDELSESSEDSVDEDSNVLCKCIGVQRFNIVQIERLEP
jgi:hypothetical protein